jgi:hypothetical protein
MDLLARYPAPDFDSWPAPLAALAEVAGGWAVSADWKAAATLAAASALLKPGTLVAGKPATFWAMAIAARHAPEVAAADAVIGAASAVATRDGQPFALYTGGGLVALAKKLAVEDRAVLLNYADFQPFLAHCRKFPQRKALVADLGEGRPIAHALDGAFVEARTPHVAVLAAVGRETLAEYAASEDFSSGYLTQFHYVDGQCEAVLPEARDDAAHWAAASALAGARRQVPRELALAGAAKGLLRNLPAALDITPSDPLGAVLQRRALVAGGLLAAWDGRDTVTEADAFAGAAVAARGEGYRRRLDQQLDDARLLAVMRLVLQRLNNAHPVVITSREIQQATHQKAQDVAFALDALVRQGKVRPQQQGGTTGYHLVGGLREA